MAIRAVEATRLGHGNHCGSRFSSLVAHRRGHPRTIEVPFPSHHRRGAARARPGHARLIKGRRGLSAGRGTKAAKPLGTQLQRGTDDMRKILRRAVALIALAVASTPTWAQEASAVAEAFARHAVIVAASDLSAARALTCRVGAPSGDGAASASQPCHSATRAPEQGRTPIHPCAPDRRRRPPRPCRPSAADTAHDPARCPARRSGLGRRPAQERSGRRRRRGRGEGGALRRHQRDAQHRRGDHGGVRRQRSFATIRFRFIQSRKRFDHEDGDRHRQAVQARRSA